MKFDRKFLLYFGLLFVALFLLVGEDVPSGNEFIYLLRLVKQYNPAFLTNDFSFSFQGNEHWLFNHIFGLPAQLISPHSLGWLGRLACWAGVLLGLFRLGRNWEISDRAIAISIFIWLCLGQSIVAEEWMIGGFEAKCVAYICLIFALDGFLRGKDIYPAALTGLAFSFHPAVGLWGGLAIGIGLLLSQTPIQKLLKIGIVTAVFAIPGLLPLVLANETISTGIDDWKHIVLVRAPAIFNPFGWSRASYAVLLLSAAFTIWIFIRREKEQKFKLLQYFLIALGLFFLFGIFLRAAERYDLMRLMPMRLFPVFVPLFFLFTFARAWRERSFSAATAAIAIAIGFISLTRHNPAVFAFDQVRDNYSTWKAKYDDVSVAQQWVGDNSDPGTVVISPPWRRDGWHHSERAQVVSYGFPVFENLPEWRRRVTQLIGDASEPEQMQANYRNLTRGQIDALAQEYGAGYLITDGDYDHNLLFVSGKWKVFKLGGK
jgi:hypothetical protein